MQNYNRTTLRLFISSSRKWFTMNEFRSVWMQNGHRLVVNDSYEFFFSWSATGINPKYQIKFIRKVKPTENDMVFVVSSLMAKAPSIWCSELQISYHQFQLSHTARRHDSWVIWIQFQAHIKETIRRALNGRVVKGNVLDSTRIYRIIETAINDMMEILHRPNHVFYNFIKISVTNRELYVESHCVHPIINSNLTDGMELEKCTENHTKS